MTENPEFDLESAWLAPAPPGDPTPAPAEVAPPEQAVAPEPVVVIRYRNRGLHPVLMLPIALIASLALLAGYHAYVEPVAGHAAPGPSPRPAATVASLDESVAQAAAAFAKDEAPLPGPLTLEGRPLPHEPAPPAKPPEAAPAPTPEPGPPPPAAEAVPAEEARSRISIASASPTFAGPTEADPAPAAEPAPPADVAKPAETPLPSQEEMMERIRQEAELKAIQRAEMERRQAEDLERLKEESVKRLEEERAQFRRQLRSILKGEPADAGAAIEALCEQFGRNYSPGVKERANAILAHNKGRLTSDAEVRILRSLGVPEPAVLDFLCNRLNRSLRSRNGPHDPDEARVVAARQLLRIPTTVAAPADSTPAPPPSPARSPVYRRAAS
ncbi:MAG: hypothetical protein BGO49_09070 [Planctomycetales bacterium 71-10]|nr:MAG: hypothetical protein BGO49_09070 [Planctomycetales bacterium 71-10]